MNPMRAFRTTLGVASICLFLGGMASGAIAACGPGIIGDGGMGDAGDAARDAAIADAGIESMTGDARAPCILGMIAWWKADDDSTDQLGAIPLSIVGAVGYAVGEVGNGFSFNTTGHLNGDASPALDGLIALSIEGWISGLSGSSAGGIIISRHSSMTSAGFSLWLHMDDAGTTTALELRVNGVPQSIPVSVDWSTPQHVAVTYDTTVGTVFYVNGIQRTPGGFIYKGPIAEGPPVVQVGVHADLANPFFGIIDELAVYNVVLTQQQIQAIIAAGAKGKCP